MRNPGLTLSSELRCPLNYGSTAALAIESEVTCANTWCAYSRAGQGTGLTAPSFNPCTHSVHLAARIP